MSTNYIHRLQEAVAAKDREIEALRQGLLDLAAYVTSPKFHEDPTVQASDIVLRVREALSQATDAALLEVRS